jgi:hypothetical protein
MAKRLIQKLFCGRHPRRLLREGNTAPPQHRRCGEEVPSHSLCGWALKKDEEGPHPGYGPSFLLRSGALRLSYSPKGAVWGNAGGRRFVHIRISGPAGWSRSGRRRTPGSSAGRPRRRPMACRHTVHSSSPTSCGPVRQTTRGTRNTGTVKRSAPPDVAGGVSAAAGARGPRADHLAGGRLVDWPAGSCGRVARRRKADLRRRPRAGRVGRDLALAASAPAGCCAGLVRRLRRVGG